MSVAPPKDSIVVSIVDNVAMAVLTAHASVMESVIDMGMDIKQEHG